MKLTSSALVYSLTVLAAVGLLATLWLWPRLARQRPLPVLGRLALLSVVQVAVLSVLGLTVNNSFGFYTSWDDLLRPGGAPLALAAAASPRGAAPDLTKLVQPTTEGGMETVKDLLPAGTPQEVGKVESIRVNGPASGLSDQVFVYLPPEYFAPEYAKMRFPAVLAIGGFPGTSLHLLDGLRLPQTVTELHRAGQVTPSVIVMARPTVAPPRNTECVDVPGGPLTETWFAKDLPNAVRSAYRVRDSENSWGVLGYSTGGSCALRLALRFPDRFAAAAALHADYQVPNDYSTGGDLFHGDTALASQSDLLWRLRNLPAPKSSLLVVSTRTEENFKATEDFLALARQVAEAHPEFKVDSTFLDDGGHNFDSWQRELPAALKWLGDRLGTFEWVNDRS
ncbi:alpha/beta hydrolase-fold protein [Kitasatospora sp. NPDC049258]|uniref:alpha/beta hydrolase n=1 Tax=Kitasatospora sp. NPDC049258 TaxID=3155394 RepID=UPI003413C939